MKEEGAVFSNRFSKGKERKERIERNERKESGEDIGASHKYITKHGVVFHSSV